MRTDFAGPAAIFLFLAAGRVTAVNGLVFRLRSRGPTTHGFLACTSNAETVYLQAFTAQSKAI
jgi:hypothetical protein